MSRVDPRTPPPRPPNVVAWSVLLASTLVLASLFQALVGSALGGPVTSTSVPGQVPPEAQGEGPSCVSLFSSGGRGPCGLGPDATTAPVPVRPSAMTAALADGDDVRARFLAGRSWPAPPPREP
jgi:hypothetical protein